MLSASVKICQARILLHSDSTSLLGMAVRWAVAVILSQTASPLLLNVRLPAELRGVSCIQDLPATRTGMPTAFVEPVALQQQAAELYELLLKLLRQATASYSDGGRAKAPQLISAVGAVARQRPGMLPACLGMFKTLLQPKEVLWAQAYDEIQKLIAMETQLLIASGLTTEWTAELLEICDLAGQSGSLEELLTCAKYKQVSAVTDDVDGTSRGNKRARRDLSKHAEALASLRFASTEEDTLDLQQIEPRFGRHNLVTGRWQMIRSLMPTRCCPVRPR